MPYEKCFHRISFQTIVCTDFSVFRNFAFSFEIFFIFRNFVFYLPYFCLPHVHEPPSRDIYFFHQLVIVFCSFDANDRKKEILTFCAECKMLLYFNTLHSNTCTNFFFLFSILCRRRKKCTAINFILSLLHILFYFASCIFLYLNLGLSTKQIVQSSLSLSLSLFNVQSTHSHTYKS